MRTKTAIAIVLTLLVGTVGLSAVPFAAAVDPDCTSDFDIADSQAVSTPHELEPAETLTAKEDVLQLTGDEEVRVSLLTNGAELTFGIFELDGTNCVRSTTVNPVECESDVVLSTEDVGVDPIISEDCEIEAPASDGKDYFFVMENTGSVTLEFEIHRV